MYICDITPTCISLLNLNEVQNPWCKLDEFMPIKDIELHKLIRYGIVIYDVIIK